MTKDTFTVFARYNGVANEKMNALIKTLSGEEWNREFGGFFKSIRALASHTYIADVTWLKRLGSLREYGPLKAAPFTASYDFKEVLFPTVEEYLGRRAELDQKITAVIGEITDADLAGTLKWTNTRGEAFEKNFALGLLQMFNHETHHRGMISLYLELLGKDNDFSSVTVAV